MIHCFLPRSAQEYLQQTSEDFRKGSDYFLKIMVSSYLSESNMTLERAKNALNALYINCIKNCTNTDIVWGVRFCAENIRFVEYDISPEEQVEKYYTIKSKCTSIEDFVDSLYDNGITNFNILWENGSIKYINFFSGGHFLGENAESSLNSITFNTDFKKN